MGSGCSVARLIPPGPTSRTAQTGRNSGKVNTVARTNPSRGKFVRLRPKRGEKIRVQKILGSLPSIFKLNFERINRSFTCDS